MSGPKIIDVEATRHAERKRIETLCAQLEAATTRHIAFSEKSGQPAFVNALVAGDLRRAAAGSDNVYQLIELRMQAADQIQFVKSETSRLRSVAIERAARNNAASSAIDEAIERSLKTVTDQAVIEELTRAQLATDADEKLRIYEAAVGMVDGATGIESNQSEAIQQWLSDIKLDSENAVELPARHPQRWRIEIERIRVEASFLDDFQSDIELSISQIEAETDPNRRTRLLDDLRYPLAEKLKLARENGRRKEWIEEWCAALAVHAEYLDLEAWEARLSSDASVSEEEIESAIDEGIAKASAAEARREIINSLQSFGYELRPGMETAFVVDGKIVLKKPGDRDYGVELSTFPQGNPGLIRTRVIRTQGSEAATENERLRDKEREESWCSDREKMAEHLSEIGISCEIKTERAAGESPVPVVDEYVTEQSRTEIAKTLKNER